jgi:hypothetical protein
MNYEMTSLGLGLRSGELGRVSSDTTTEFSLLEFGLGFGVLRTGLLVVSSEFSGASLRERVFGSEFSGVRFPGASFPGVRFRVTNILRVQGTSN